MHACHGDYELGTSGGRYQNINIRYQPLPLRYQYSLKNNLILVYASILVRHTHLTHTFS